MNKIRVICIFYTLLISACQEKKEAKKANDLNWDMLDIEIQDDSKIEKFAVFSSNEDSCRYILTIRDEDHFRKFKCFDKKRVTFILSKEQKIKLYQLFKDLFLNPTSPKYEVSCYAGEDVKFTINQYGRSPSLTCKYSSIANWSETSNTTKKIYDLTFKKIYAQDSLKVECKH
jgi:hypothetical protein